MMFFFQFEKKNVLKFEIPKPTVGMFFWATEDDFIDVIEANRIYIPCIYVLNKIDQISIQELDNIYKITHCVNISAHHGEVK